MAGIDEFNQGGIAETVGLGGMSAIPSIMIWIIGSIVFASVIGVIAWIVIRQLQFNQKVKVFSNIGGNAMLKYATKGKFQPIGKAGDRVFILKKPKGKTVPAPTIQSGIREWWFFEREDGELINFRLKDLDKEMKESGAFYISSDMRLERLAIERNLEARFNKQKFWEKYGQQIMGILFFVIVTILLVVLFMQLEEVGKSLEGATNTAGEVLEKIANMESNNPQRPSGETPNIIPT